MPKFHFLLHIVCSGAFAIALPAPAGRAAVLCAAAERSCLRDRRAGRDHRDESIQEEYAKLARDILPKSARATSPEAGATCCSKGDELRPVAWRYCSSRAWTP